MNPSPPSVLEAALGYASLGWSIIPIKAGTKLPLCRWEQFQRQRAGERQLRRWFGDDRPCGLAVVCGAVSGGLVCRDFDDVQAYARWAAAYPQWATRLPTVRTSRGRHVYFRAAEKDLRYVDLRQHDPPENGEYRGDSGHYCILPPSLHPDGAIYGWSNPIIGDEVPFIDDIRAAGLLVRHVTERTECSESTESTESTEDSRREQRITEAIVVCAEPEVSAMLMTGNIQAQHLDHGTRPLPGNSMRPVLPTKDNADIERAILDALPTGIGQRNRQVFELARALKAIPRLADAPANALKSYVRRWHQTGVQRGVIATEPFEETWIDFLHGWPKVKFAKGYDPLGEALRRAQAAPLPPEAQSYEGGGPRLLVALCRELQRLAGPEPFFLSCRTAARLLELGPSGHVRAWRWLGLLVDDGILKLVEPGQQRGGRAARYQYLPGSTSAAMPTGSQAKP